MKRFFLLISIIIAAGQVLLSQPPPPFEPWLVNVAVENVPVYIQKLEPFTPLLNETEPLQFTPPCYDDTTCDNWDEWKKDTAIVEHPNFPGCPILVSLKHRVCISNPRIIQHYLLGYVIGQYQNDPDCDALENWLKSGNQWLPDRQVQLEHDIYALMARQFFIDFNNMLMNSYYGKDTLYCTKPDGSPDYDHVRVSYVKGACKGWCVGSYTLTEGSHGTWHHPKNCDESACCKVTNRFCIDRHSGQLMHYEEKALEGVPAGCYEDPMTIEDCYSFLTSLIDEWDATLEDSWVIECRPTCDTEFLDLGGEQIIK